MKCLCNFRATYLWTEIWWYMLFIIIGFHSYLRCIIFEAICCIFLQIFIELPAQVCILKSENFLVINEIYMKITYQKVAFVNVFTVIGIISGITVKFPKPDGSDDGTFAVTSFIFSSGTIFPLFTTNIWSLMSSSLFLLPGNPDVLLILFINDLRSLLKGLVLR